MNFTDWVLKNKISVEKKDENKFNIDGVGEFIIIKGNGEKIIDENFRFILDDAEAEELENKEDLNIVFEFGGEWYHCKKNKVKNKYGLVSYKPEFNLFKSVGLSSEEHLLDFVHLGVHTEYELMNGSGSTEEWANKAKFLKHKHLGICDKNTLAATLSFQISCEKNNIKSIIGETISVANNYDEEDKNQELFSLKLYVVNKEGWKNLLLINKVINVDYDGYIPDFLLEKYGKGICCIIDKDSMFPILMKDKNKCEKWIKYLKSIFDKIYFQIDTVEYFSDKAFRDHLQCIDEYMFNYIGLVEPILINDSFYVEEESFELKKNLNQINQKVNLESKNQYYKDVSQTLNSYSEWLDCEILYNTLIKGIENTVDFSETVDFKILTGERNLPRFKSKDVETLFFNEVEKGFVERLNDLSSDQQMFYFERLQRECDVIQKADLCDYFMILWDIMKYCRKEDIQTGTGRGSVCGSLVAYLLKITEIDPIKYDLLFERFLNETRVSGERAKTADALPDIDLDFQTERRADVRIYIEKKYGQNHVGGVSTYVKMQLKTCLKDFAKIRGFDFKQMNKLTKEIKDQIDYSFSDLIEYSTDSDILFNFVQNNPGLIKLIRDSMQKNKAHSIHPSAVVIFPNKNNNGDELNIFEWLPVKKVNGVIITEWEGKYIDKCGFLKEDLLGLSQLDKFQYIMKDILKNKGTEIILSDIRMDESNVYTFFKRGWCEDIFQFGTSGLINYCKRVKPEKITDLIAMNALYRPGPMESNAHNDFADIKIGKKKPKYDKGMEKITEETLSLYIYQEQIMKAAVVGGLTEVESDIMRTAIKKKDFNEINFFRSKFVNKYSEEVGKEKAISVWNKLIAFSGYGFNKSHSAAYSVMGYYSQWFKVNYPLEFWTTSLQFSSESEIPFRLSEINKIGVEIEIRPPDINYSGISFSNDGKNKIFFSLLKINGVGEVAVNDILNARKNGVFYDFDDFISRITSKTNSNVIIRLIICGAFDLMYNIEYIKDRNNILLYYLELKNKVIPKEFEDMNFSISEEWIMMQKKLTGFGDVNYKNMIYKVVSDRMFGLFIESENFQKQQEGMEVLIVGKVVSVFTKEIKTGLMARIQIDSNSTIIDCSIWPDIWIKLQKDEMYYKNKTICINGVVNKFAGRKTLTSNRLTKLIEL